MELLAALGIGFLGSSHCIAMCGGVCAALSFALPAQRPWWRVLILVGYNVGRISSYMIAGALVGWLTAVGAQEHLTPMRILAGVMMIAMGLYLGQWWLGLTYLEKAGQRLWGRLQPLSKSLMPVDSIPKALGFGAVWGWLPCGLVYSTLTLAASQANVFQGALVMGAFGLGTLPAMFVSGLLAERLKQWTSRRALQKIFGVLLIVFGVWTLYLVYLHGGHDHHGSHGHHSEPVMESDQKPMEHHHHHHH
ncbi:sulfite exporter TauE/SafE family protein [Marinibactrum halimedae]|uniref:Membrane protein n=1 Tax=Marinibactrum halimedae TaxID=1444977 RepID=A0AA37WMA4_9GAMM|nr:sulfite exporter TauE/SafE family protein [Marinibactrum halimedae]MCD9457922.1 sulfite exporter TauE/SafE family protein [Marinibactrum halimedae]GLS26253.1 membrane protein [Marinibactrum halimedae]